MREKAEILFDAVTSIRPELVEQAQDYVFHRRTAWRRMAPLAACLALTACLGWYGLLLFGGGSGGSDMGPAESAGSYDDRGDAVSTDSNSAPPPPAAVDSAPPSAEPAPVEGAEDRDLNGSDTPDATPGDMPPGAVAPEELEFTARVIKLDQALLVVRPLPGGDLPAGTDRAEVVLEGVSEVPELQVGDKVRITFTGDLTELGTLAGEFQGTYPLQITGVTAITLEE